MGLTIHYTLAVRHQLQDADAGELVAQARSFARAAEADSVSRRFTTERPRRGRSPARERGARGTPAPARPGHAKPAGMAPAGFECRNAFASRATGVSAGRIGNQLALSNFVLIPRPI